MIVHVYIYIYIYIRRTLFERNNDNDVDGTPFMREVVSQHSSFEKTFSGDDAAASCGNKGSLGLCSGEGKH